MKLLMLSGDRDVAIGRTGPFHTTLEGLLTEFERIDVLTPNVGSPSKKNPYAGVVVESSPVSRLRQASWLRKRGAELLYAYGHDLIVSHDYGIFSNGRAASFLSRMSGTPYVSEIHHVPGYPRRAQWWEPIEQIIYRVYLTRVARGAVAIRVVNRFEVPMLLGRWGIPMSRILVLPSAYIDRSIFHPAKTHKEHKEYALGFVGRLVANKNLGYVARVFSAVAAKWPSARFVVAGEGPERRPFQRELARAGILENVMFVDWLETTQELAALYRSLNALISPSVSEGGPRVCLEAMACGTAVFATPVGVMPETVDHGTNGWLLPWDAGAGASLVIEMLRTPEGLRDVGAAACTSTVHFEKSAVLNAYAAAYRELARKPVND